MKLWENPPVLLRIALVQQGYDEQDCALFVVGENRPGAPLQSVACAALHRTSQFAYPKANRQEMSGSNGLLTNIA